MPAVLPPLDFKPASKPAAGEVQDQAIDPWQSARWVWDNAKAARQAQEDGADDTGS